MLKIKAELENVTGLQPAADDFDYFFKVHISLHNLLALCSVRFLRCLLRLNARNATKSTQS